MQLTQLSNLIEKLTYKVMSKKNPAEDAELSGENSEDALFDTELHAFFQAEYGDKLPSRRVSQRLAVAIQMHSEQQRRLSATNLKNLPSRLVLHIRRMPGAIYRFSSRPNASRLLSGSVLAALLVMAIAPRTLGSLADQGFRSAFSPQTNSTGDFWSAARMEKAAKAGLIEETLVQPQNTTSGIIAEPSQPQQVVYAGIGVEQRRLILAQRTGENLHDPVMEQPQGLDPFELRQVPKTTGNDNPGSPGNQPGPIQW